MDNKLIKILICNFTNVREEVKVYLDTIIEALSNKEKHDYSYLINTSLLYHQNRNTYDDKDIDNKCRIIIDFFLKDCYEEELVTTKVESTNDRLNISKYVLYSYLEKDMR